MSDPVQPPARDLPRRDFLKHAAAGAAGIALAAVPGAGHATSMSAASYARILGANDRVRVGVVGYSDRFRQTLLPAFRASAKALDFEIVALSDIWSRRREEGVAQTAQALGTPVRGFRNNEELYDARMTDAVRMG